MTTTIADHILQALNEAAPDGLTATQISLIVSARRGRPTSQEAVSASISQFKTSHPRGPFLRLTIVKRIRRWTLEHAPAGIETEDRLADTSGSSSLAHATLTAALLGDPLPGRSALDQRDQRRAA